LPSKHNPADSLADVVENAERIEGYIAGMEQSDFDRNGLVRDGAERCLERVREAIYRLGDEAETLMPGQPWRQIRGMGNRLRHAYDRITIDVLWSTVRYDLPELAIAAGQALATLEGGDRPEGPA
jgi:uncharacterized protein with HEPN domain